MSKNCVNIAVVGMGIGRPNGLALANNERGKVVALCDLDQSRMEDFAKDLPDSVRYYTDYKEMCQDPDIDAVFVGTPNQWHVPIGLEVVKNGKHVMITKPLADSESAAEEMVAAANEAGVVNMMSLSTRFDDGCRHLGHLARDGYFGELYYARSRSVRRNGIPAWNLGFIKKGGGAFRDMGVHALDAVWWVLGTPKPVHVIGTAGAKFGPHGRGYGFGREYTEDVFQQFEADDYAGGFITFENGLGLQIESFWASHQPGEFQMELFGTEAGAKLHPLMAYRCDDNQEEDIQLEPTERMGSWDRIADHFISCILDGVVCEAPLQHGLVVQKMMEGLLHSAEIGKPVSFE